VKSVRRASRATAIPVRAKARASDAPLPSPTPTTAHRGFLIHLSIERVHVRAHCHEAKPERYIGVSPQWSTKILAAASRSANVDAARVEGADQDPANWMTYGGTYSEKRFST
jgi:hypothetical protein